VSGRQRLIFLAIAVVIAVVAVVAVAAGGGDDGDQAAETPTPTPTATATPTGTAEPEETETPTPEPTPPPPPLMSDGETLRFTEGERIRFRVRSPDADEIHVHGYDITREIGAGQTVTLSFPATITGIFEVEFHSDGELIGNLRVDPD
jgi:hypothetical protein